MRRSASIFVVVALLVLPVAFAQAPGTILIKNGHIIPVVGPSIEKGSLLIREGKIVDIGTNIKAPSGATIIDAEGRYVYPGMVAPLTAVGVTGYPRAGNDTDETGVSTPHMDPYDALNPEDDCIDVTRIDGVTTVLTVSGSRNVLNGKAIVLNLDGNLAHELLLERDVAQVFNMTAKRDGKYPSTLQGVNAFVRDKLYEAKRYAEKKEKNGDEDSFKRDLEMEALLPVVNKEMPAIFLTSDEVTIRNALRMIEEYDLKGIIQAGADILKYADQLAAKKIPVIWSGTTTIPKRWEPVDLNYHTAAVLA